MAIIKTNRSKRTPYKKTTLGYAEDYITASSIIMNDGLSLQDVYNKMQKDSELFWNNNNQPINSNTLYNFDEPIPDNAKYLTIVIGVANDKNGMPDGNCGIETIMLNNDTLGKVFWIKCMANTNAYCNFAFSTDRKKCSIGDIYRGSGWGSVNLYINLYYGYELSTGQIIANVQENTTKNYDILYEIPITKFTQTTTAPTYTLTKNISDYKRLKIYTVQNDGYKKTFEVWNNGNNFVTTQVDYQIPANQNDGRVYMQSVIYKIEGSTITGILCSDYLSNSTYRAMYDIGIERVVGYTY